MPEPLYLYYIEDGASNGICVIAKNAEDAAKYFVSNWNYPYDCEPEHLLCVPIAEGNGVSFLQIVDLQVSVIGAI